MGRRDRDDRDDPYEDDDRPRERRDRSVRRSSREDDFVRREAGNKIAAGLCGILIGGLGVHKFVLGMTTPGIIMLLVSLLTCGMAMPIMSIIGMIEGIIYLTKSDEEFVYTYVEGKKEWF